MSKNTLSTSKYHNRKTVYQGIQFDSHKEANRYQELLLLERAGEIRNLERQTQYKLVVNGVRIASYRADFRYLDVATGNIVVEDVKGYRTREYVIKRKLMFALFGITIMET